MPAEKGTYAFQDCVVLNFNQQQNMYLVKLAADQKEPGTCSFPIECMHGLHVNETAAVSKTTNSRRIWAGSIVQLAHKIYDLLFLLACIAS